MKNRYLMLAFVVVVAIFLGVTITVQRVNNPLMRRLIEQQNQILNTEKAIQKQLAKLGGQTPSAPAVVKGQPQPARGCGGANKFLEQRVVELEKKVASLSALLKKMPQAPGKAQRPTMPADEYTKVHQIDVSHSPIWGKEAAPITLVEFVDVQCPYCSRFHSVIEEVLAAYPDKVRYVMKNFPLGFHPQAKPAAKAAFAAGEQGKYYEMVGLLLQNSRSLSDEKFAELAEELDLDVKKFKKDYKAKDAQYETWIQEDMMLGSKVAVRGTPTFYLNGRKTAARDSAMFKKEIDAILEGK